MLGNDAGAFHRTWTTTFPISFCAAFLTRGTLCCAAVNHAVRSMRVNRAKCGQQALVDSLRKDHNRLRIKHLQRVPLTITKSLTQSGVLSFPTTEGRGNPTMILRSLQHFASLSPRQSKETTVLALNATISPCYHLKQPRAPHYGLLRDANRCRSSGKDEKRFGA